MSPTDSVDHVDHHVVTDDGESTRESRKTTDDIAPAVRRSKVRVLQYSRSDLLI